MVPSSWIIKCLKIVKVADNMTRLLKNETMGNDFKIWNMELGNVTIR